MAIEDADTGENASVVPITVESSSPSERSRSDKREKASKASQVAVMPLTDAARFGTVDLIITHPGRACQLIQIMCSLVMLSSISRSLMYRTF